MPDDPWDAVRAALSAAERPVRVWLRDDDAVAPTPALDRLADLCQTLGLPVLLAVIPAGATPSLASWLAAHPFVTPCQHGFAHRNQAAAGERACEVGGERPDAAVLAELAAGRHRLQDLLGPALAGILVPPWNRIRASLTPLLAGLGLRALSAWGHPWRAPSPVRRLDCDLDIIDWRNGRRGRTIPDLCRRLVPLVETAGRTGQPVGVLTHHLAHDEAAWAFLDAFAAELRDHPRLAATSAVRELQALRDPPPPDRP